MASAVGVMHRVFPGSPGRRWSFTSIVMAMVALLLVIVSISMPAGYLLVHIQYQHGQVDSESEVNAGFIAEKLEEHPDWLITHPALQHFVNEDVVFKDADQHEARVILAADGKEVFAKGHEQNLAWPVVSERTAIVRDGKTMGYYVIARSLAHIVHQAVFILIASLFGSSLLAFLLHRFALRGMRTVEQDLSRNARFDSLTGLPNRSETIKELKRRLALKEHGNTALFLVDMDKFKVVNDSHGHAIGNELLKISASRLRSCMRPEDFVARLSGDEFVILAGLGDGAPTIKDVSESLGKAFSDPHICLGREVAITATVGIALAPHHGNQAEQLMQHADTAMNALKSAGRSGWQIYQPEMTEKIDREVRLRAKLRQALGREEFELYYQPIIRLSDNKTIGAEALIRWHDSETGLLVPPLDFISELEHSGLIVPVGEWVLRTACRQVAQWRKTLPRFHIAVNVSARQFMEEGFVASVARILQEEKVAPDAIAIELTESMLLDDAVALGMLAQLDAIGIWLALDDFGTGYSSLGRLASMPFDVLKIDRQFIEQMNMGARQRTVVVSILALSDGLKMNVVAEGIETDEQRQTLVELGCEQGQGYWFSRPVPAEAFNARYIETPQLSAIAIE